jgi:hypothetical protein
MSGLAEASTNTLVKALNGAGFGLGVSELVAPGKAILSGIAGLDLHTAFRTTGNGARGAPPLRAL